jgi:hypothetical protein
LKRLALLLACVIAPPLAHADAADSAANPSRGPSEIRDGQLLAQPRLTLPALSPHTTRRGAWELQVSGLWANSFSWTQSKAGETPETRRFLIDGESLVLDATLRRGLARNLDVGVRLPVHGRTGGTLDSFIDWWHRLAHVPDGKRPAFLQDAFRVEGVTTEKVPFSWNDESGFGLGNLELDARWRVVEGAFGSASVALLARASLPTGTGPFDGHGAGAGGQIVVGAPLGRSFDLYAGAGATVQRQGPVLGVLYAPVRAHGFLALEWRPWRRLSLVAETDAASRLVENVYSYPGLHWIVNLTGRIDLGGRTRLDLGLTENLKSQLTTTDFAFYLGFGIRP